MIIIYVQVSNSAQQSVLVIKSLSIIRNETSIAAEIPPGKEKSTSDILHNLRAIKRKCLLRHKSFAHRQQRKVKQDFISIQEFDRPNCTSITSAKR